MAGPLDTSSDLTGPPDTPAIEFLDGAFAIYRFAPGDALPDVSALTEPWAMVRTDEGVTLVCHAESPVTPQGVPAALTERCRRPPEADLPTGQRGSPRAMASLPHTFRSDQIARSPTSALGSELPFEAAEASTGWSAFRVVGPLDFALTGVLAGISDVLAEAGISIFAISCWETDYVLVQHERREDTRQALAAAGYPITAG